MTDLPDSVVKFKMLFEELSFMLTLLNDLRTLTPQASKQQKAINAIMKAQLSTVKEILEIYINIYDLEQLELLTKQENQ